jgi:antitoxin FitA
VAQLVVRNIESAVKARLQRRARHHGRSMEEEVRDILRNAVIGENLPSYGLGTEIASIFSENVLNSEIQELRGHRINPPEFDE